MCIRKNQKKSKRGWGRGGERKPFTFKVFLRNWINALIPLKEQKKMNSSE